MATLFEPVSLGDVQLRNRIVFAPVCTGMNINSVANRWL